MKTGKPARPVLSELIELQKDIENALKTQKRFTRLFGALVRNGEAVSQIIGHLDCPAAVFGRGGFLHMANPALLRETGLSGISGGEINFLDGVTDENYAMLEAAESVFEGKTTLLKRLSRPLALFCKDGSEASGAFSNALFFPVQDRGKNILFGIVMLLR